MQNRTMFDFLNSNEEVLKALHRNKIISSVWLRDIQMYKLFVQLGSINVLKKYSIIATRYGISIETVRKRIKLMKENL